MPCAQVGKFHCNLEHHVHSDTCLMNIIVIIHTRYAIISICDPSFLLPSLLNPAVPPTSRAWQSEARSKVGLQRRQAESR